MIGLLEEIRQGEASGIDGYVILVWRSEISGGAWIKRESPKKAHLREGQSNLCFLRSLIKFFTAVVRPDRTPNSSLAMNCRV